MTCLMQLREEFWCSIFLYIFISRKNFIKRRLLNTNIDTVHHAGRKRVLWVIGKYTEKDLRAYWTEI